MISPRDNSAQAENLTVFKASAGKPTDKVNRIKHLLPNREFRALASRMLTLRDNPESHKTIGVASCSHNEGNTTLAGNLAVALNDAVEGQVLLIDCNEPKKTLLKRTRSPGWFELVFGKAQIEDVIQATDSPKLDMISAGLIDPSGFTYNRDRLTTIVHSLKERYEFVVFDLPCMEDMSGCLPIASVLDGVVLNLKSGSQSSNQAMRTINEFKVQGANVLGVVLNQTRSHLPWLLKMFLGNSTS